MAYCTWPLEIGLAALRRADRAACVGEGILGLRRSRRRGWLRRGRWSRRRLRPGARCGRYRRGRDVGGHLHGIRVAFDDHVLRRHPNCLAVEVDLIPVSASVFTGDVVALAVARLADARIVRAGPTAQVDSRVVDDRTRRLGRVGRHLRRWHLGRVGRHRRSGFNRGSRRRVGRRDDRGRRVERRWRKGRLGRARRRWRRGLLARHQIAQGAGWCQDKHQGSDQNKEGCVATHAFFTSCVVWASQEIAPAGRLKSSWELMRTRRNPEKQLLQAPPDTGELLKGPGWWYGLSVHEPFTRTGLYHSSQQCRK